MNWETSGILAGIVLTILFFVRAYRQRPPFLGWFTGFCLVLIAALNSVAPFRGALDAGYVGYQNGFLSAERGLSVTFFAGSIVIVSLIAAWIALRHQQSRGHWFTALVCLFLALNSGIPALMAIDRSAFQLGDLVRLDGIAAFAVIFGLQSLPTIIGATWAAKQAAAAMKNEATPVI